MTTDSDLQDRFRFFLQNAGYATPPGRAACALALARAEQRLAADVAGGALEVVVEADQDHDAGPCVPAAGDAEHAAFVRWRAWWERQVESGALEVVAVALVDDAGDVVASLHGVDSPPGDGDAWPLAGYRRVVAAELAQERYSEQDQQRRAELLAAGLNPDEQARLTARLGEVLS